MHNSASLRRSIAASLDAPVALAPHVQSLFAGIPSLGSSPGVTARLLRSAGIGPGSRGIDLACGKGTAAVLAARSLGCRVTGVDACAAFIEEARALALRRGVRRLVRFVEADARRLPAELRRPFDAALMLGLWPLRRASRVLRPLTRPGGVYLIDDCVTRGPARAGTLTLTQGYAHVEGLGDWVEAVELASPSDQHRRDQRLSRAIARRAAALARREPSLRAPINRFLARQRSENRRMRSQLRPCLWVIRRGP